MNEDRLQFEAWAFDQGFNLDRNHDDSAYRYDAAAFAWAGYQAARAWRPISEAPRDGTLILVTNPSAVSLEPKVTAAFYDSRDDEFVWWFIDPEIGQPVEDQINGWIDDPRLLWQPMPPEPQS